MMKKTVLSLSMALALSACGADHVETIKNSAIEGMEGQTYSSILDNRTVCTDPRWMEVKDSDENVPVVEYRCTLEGGVALMAKERDAVLEDQRNRHEQGLQNLQQQVDHYQKMVDSYREKLAEMEQEGADRNAIIHQKRNVKGAEDLLDTFENQLASAKEGHQEDIAEITASYDLSSLDEVYTWQIRDDGPRLMDADLVKVTKAGEEERRDYNTYDQEELFTMVSESEMETTDGVVTADTYFEHVMVNSMLR